LELGAERVEPATIKEMKNLKRGFEGMILTQKKGEKI
jgi:hypothetical protein